MGTEILAGGGASGALGKGIGRAAAALLAPCVLPTAGRANPPAPPHRRNRAATRPSSSRKARQARRRSDFEFSWNGKPRKEKFRLKQIGKPDSVMASIRGHSDHSSSPAIARRIERPYPRAMGGPPNPPIWPCSGWGLPCARHHWRAGELLPRLFTLTRLRGRYVFCGTFPRSLGAAVSGHPVLWSPDFPLPCGSDRLICFSPKFFYEFL